MGPPPQEVLRLLEDLCAAINDVVLTPVIQAGLVHAQFEVIHPFLDGNGCTGRALIHVVLRRRGLTPMYVPPISVVLAGDKGAYTGGLDAYARGLRSPGSHRCHARAPHDLRPRRGGRHRANQGRCQRGSSNLKPRACSPGRRMASATAPRKPPACLTSSPTSKPASRCRHPVPLLTVTGPAGRRRSQLFQPKGLPVADRPCLGLGTYLGQRWTECNRRLALDDVGWPTRSGDHRTVSEPDLGGCRNQGGNRARRRSGEFRDDPGRGDAPDAL